MKTYIINERPQQQERVRASTRMRYQHNQPKAIVTMYDPKNSKNAKERIAHLLQQQQPTCETEALSVSFSFYIPIPKSYTKKVRKQIKEGTYHATKKPDLSNYIKLIEDAANGILWTDDSLIVEIHATKQYSDNPRTEITVEHYQPKQKE